MIHRYGLPAILALLMSCSDAGPVLLEALPELPGTVAFTYNGTVMSGTFNAVGKLPAQNQMTTTTWTIGLRYVDFGTVGLNAHVPGNGIRYTLDLYVRRNTPGSSPVNGDCGPGPGISCTGVVMFLDYPGGFSTVNPNSCVLGSGTVTITSMSETRMAGTFSGTGVCISGTGSGPTVTSFFEVTSGSFDVPLEAR
jgi:hypothetical protein